MLCYGFDTLNLHNIMLQCDSNNKQGMACYIKVGFREFGRRRASTYKDGSYFDTVYMDILAPEFKKIN
jgi:RimJ/RimL family protein N-acetyltransferase